MIKEIVVVEGHADTAAIKRAVDADTIETGGSALDEMTLRTIALAQQRRGVIIFTDPDYAGERIRTIISQRISGCKHAFLPQEEAVKYGDIGIEHASPAAIRQALANVRTENWRHRTDITWSDLLQRGLINHPQAAKRRRLMGDTLGIGYNNGKQFFKRCHMLQITRAEFEAAYEQMMAREETAGDGS